MNFFHAISMVLEENENVSFMIGGNGPLSSQIDAEIKRGNLNRRVKNVGWISHDDELPVYLNTLKILVLPSYSEGLPAVILEAMACGTPVLVTPVGGLPEIVKNGQTGFLLKDNSPECIAKNIIDVLKCENLDEVSRKARNIILQNFTYEVAVRKYRSLLSQLRGDLNFSGES